MGLEMEYIDDQTPLDEDEKGGLLIGTITTRSEVDQFEQLNIEKGNYVMATIPDTHSEAFLKRFIITLISVVIVITITCCGPSKKELAAKAERLETQRIETLALGVGP